MTDREDNLDAITRLTISPDLQAKLQNVRRELDIHLIPSNRHEAKEALEFLSDQQARVEKAEIAFREAIRDLLPGDMTPSSLTTAEAAFVLEELRNIYHRQEKRLLEKIQETQEEAQLQKSLANNSFRANKNSFRPPPFVARVLPDIPEVEHEMDGSSTLTGIRFSAQKKITTTLPQNTPMHAQPTQNPPTTGRKRQDAFRQLERQLKRDVHKVLLVEGRLSSDNSNVHLSKDEPYSDDHKPAQVGHDTGLPYRARQDIISTEEIPAPQKLDNGFLDADIPGAETFEDSLLDEDDDSALYCATVVADRNTYEQFLPDKSRPPRASDHRPSQVQFANHEGDDDDSTNDQTLLTMEDIRDLGDDGVLPMSPDDDEAEQNSSVISASSTETPVLDRYRLAIDATSIYGVRVVPNERRKHHNNRQRNHRDNYRLQNRPQVFHQQKEPPLQSISETQVYEVISPTISVRNKFRKTPHPNKRNDLQVEQTIDENTPLNFVDNGATPTMSNNTAMWATTPHTLLRSPLHSLLSSGGENISLLTSPATRPRALLHCDIKSVDVGKTASSLYPAKAALLRNKTSASELLTAGAHKALSSLRPRLENISASEYEGAPRVVKMHLTLEQARDAVSAINKALARSSMVGNTVELSEKDLRDILAPLSERECRNVAMSLCHWRRFLLRKLPRTNDDGDSGKVLFSVICNS